MEQRFALLLGNSEYEDGTLASFSAPHGDVSSFAGVLRDPEIGQFNQVSTLVNQAADEIRKGIARFSPIASAMICSCFTSLATGF